jgi:hypothetical protein
MNKTPANSFQDLIVWQKAHQFVFLGKQEFSKLLDAYPTSLLTPNS